MAPDIDTHGESLGFTLASSKLIRVIFISFLCIELLLVFLDATVNYARWTDIGAIRRLFNLTREDGLGNWFASTQTLFVGLILWLIFMKTKRDNAIKAWGWAGIAVFFTYLAIDDGAKIHERIGTTVKAVGWAEFFPSYAWHLVFAPFLVAMGLFILIFMWKELRVPSLRLFLLLGMSCYAISVGLDFVEGLTISEDWILGWELISPEALRHFAKVLEEFLEMLGTTFFLISVLSHFTRISPSLSVRFQ